MVLAYAFVMLQCLEPFFAFVRLSNSEMALTSMVMGQHIKGFQDLLYSFTVQDNKK